MEQAATEEDKLTNKESDFEKPLEKLHLYKMRWLVLIIYTLVTSSHCLQIMQYSVIADITMEYYQVSVSFIEWTTMVCYVVSVTLFFPAGLVAAKLGIRRSMIISSIGISVATWIKLITINPNRFWLIIVAHGLQAGFQIIMYPLISTIAATWFGANETSTACAAGYIGVQIGYAFSFLISPLVIQTKSIAEIEHKLFNMNLCFAIYSTVIAILVLLFVKNKPAIPPSLAQDNLIKIKKSKRISALKIVKNLFSNKSYYLYMITNSINFGVNFSLKILSNQIILAYYPDSGTDVGVIGLLQSLLGVLGSIIISIVLDKYKKYKETTWIVYSLNFLLILLYLTTLGQGLPVVYVTAFFMGIIGGSLITLPMEVAVEITYGEPENIAVGIISNASDTLTIVFTFFYSYMFRTVSAMWSNVTVLAMLLLSDLLLFVLKFNLKRQEVERL